MAGTRWVKLDTSYLRNPKITAITPAARLLHIASICWTADQLTDGHIPQRTLRELSESVDIDPRWASRRARELERAGLWERNGSGWQVHDFVVMNPGATRAGVEKERQRWRDRKAQGWQRPS